MHSLTESQVICLVASFVAVIMGYAALPTFNLTTGKQLSFENAEWVLTLSIVLAVAVGLLSSSIPSIQAFNAGTILASNPVGARNGKSTLRTALIISQFSISMLLIIGTLVVSSQLDFLKSARLGFNGENIVVVPIKDRTLNDRHSTIVNEISQLAGVEGASFSSSTPACNNSLTYTYSFLGTEINDRPMATFLVDENFLDVFKIKLNSGRLINPASKDTLSEMLLNEAAVEHLNLSAPIGQLVTGKAKGRVVGVTENFNHTSLHSGIEPVIMYAYLPTFRFVSVKLKESETAKGLTSLESKWPELYEGYPLEYSFLKDQIQQLYSAEVQLSRSYTSFSVLAIIIAGIGLIGLSTFSISRRHKEMSIRRVFGGSTLQIVRQFYSAYSRIVLITVLVSWTLGYYLMSRWLTGFAYRTELRFYHFITPVLVMTIVLLVTTGIQTLKASVRSPIKDLRDE